MYRIARNIWFMAGCWKLRIQGSFSKSLPEKPGISCLRIWTLSVGNGSH